MKKRVPNQLLDELSAFVAAQMGLHFQKGRQLDLLRGIRSAASEFGFSDVTECIEWLLSRPLKKHQVEVLASHLTVGETYFIREPKVFEALEKTILPELIRKRWDDEKRIRIWSAASCSGEEPYSIAILLDRIIPDLQSWNIEILATDINPLFLNRASQGLYREWSFRGTPYWLKENYFKTNKDGFYEIIPRIKRMVKIQYLNLVEDIYPSVFNNTNAMDIIFCRNVLMYFSDPQVKNVIERLYHSLLDDGCLIVASSETSPIFNTHFKTENHPGAILYRKNLNLDEKGAFVFPPHLYADYDLPATQPEFKPFKLRESSFKPIEAASQDVQKTSYVVEDEPEKELVDIVVEVEDAVEILVEAEEVIPKTVFERATELYDQGKYHDTVQVISVLVEKEHENVEAMALMAKSFANQGKLNDALSWCEKALAIERLNPERYHLHAVILMEKGELMDAITSFKRALYLDPNYVLAYFMLGNITKQVGREMESIKYFQNALHLLEDHKQEDILPSSEGITAGRLKELILAMINEGKAA
ncbi:tetratricopeptide repeat protein [candidate division KSB1 bacterium]|nr:tetratricopeptide repeat protein [candidate division KSB1 bacterium]